MLRTRILKLRLRRKLRKSQRQVESLGSQAGQGLEQHFFKRFARLNSVRRFVLAWTGLLLILIWVVVAQILALSNHYQAVRPVAGGIYQEGVLGRFTNASPIYATSDADTTVSRLLFAGLFRYDERGNLIGDLAESYEVGSSGSVYTVRLKPNLTWQDGRKLTSADVVFTYKTIQNPDVGSPFQSSWQGIEITAPDPRTVVFTLPGVLAAFPYNLTTGIVPKHLLDSVSPTGLRSADFNTVRPVGAGPFMWGAVEVVGDADPLTAQQHIALEPFSQYQAGPPKLQKFVVQAFADRAQLIKAFQDEQLTAIKGLDAVPAELKGGNGVLQYDLPLRAATMVFFKTSGGVLSEQPVRQALVKGANVPAIVEQLGYPTRQVRSPILAGQVGYDKSLGQSGYNPAEARQQLDSAGWVAGRNGLRSKGGQPLSFNLTAANTPEYRMVARQLAKQWGEIGVKVTARLLSPAEFQNALTNHDYDAVINGISIGKDPDVFVYWHSSQADIRAANRLNLSEYNNPAADAALEAGRTRIDPEIRKVKYRPFLEAWQSDAPALGLYQPRILYLTRGAVAGLDNRLLTTAADRFNNVDNWQISEARVTD